MSEIPRFTVDELQTRYELEPELDDIYVEGFFDKEVIERVIYINEQPRRAIYTIDTVDVPPQLVESHKLTDGNKQRVITLARELAKINGERLYRCLVDRDLDHWFGPLERTKNLAWTDHTSIELYYLSEEFIRDIILVTARCKIVSWGDFYVSLIATLRSLYAMRLADRSMDLSMKWINYEKSLDVKGSEILFDQDAYIDKLLVANGSMSRRREYKKVLQEWCEKLTNDPRSHIRGHDLVPMLSWAVKSFKGQRDYASDTAIERIFVLLASRATDVLIALK